MKERWLEEDFFRQDAVVCARSLIGIELVWDGCRGVIVETEAYQSQGDPACHTFFKPSARQFVQDYPPGTLYVYLNYGVHWMLNWLTKTEASTGFVLLRALRPIEDLDLMAGRRGRPDPYQLCSGPGKLTQALAIDRQDHGAAFFQLSAGGSRPAGQADQQRSGGLANQRPVARGLRQTRRRPPVLCDSRIGISRGQSLPWRFTSAHDQQWVSRPCR